MATAGQGATGGANKHNSNKTYIILRNLGEGSFGKVKEALHVLSQEKIAVKVIEKEKITAEDDKVRVKREIEILKKVRHPNIVQLYEVIETEKYHFMVMEYVERGELADYIESREKVSRTVLMVSSRKLKLLGCFISSWQPLRTFTENRSPIETSSPPTFSWIIRMISNSSTSDSATASPKESASRPAAGLLALPLLRLLTESSMIL